MDVAKLGEPRKFLCLISYFIPSIAFYLIGFACQYPNIVEINSDQRLWMHQLVRDMGREIARQESPNCQRIWHHGDAFTVLEGTTVSS